MRPLLVLFLLSAAVQAATVSYGTACTVYSSSGWVTDPRSCTVGQTVPAGRLPWEYFEPANATASSSFFYISEQNGFGALMNLSAYAEIGAWIHEPVPNGTRSSEFFGSTGQAHGTVSVRGTTAGPERPGAILVYFASATLETAYGDARFGFQLPQIGKNISCSSSTSIYTSPSSETKSCGEYMQVYDFTLGRPFEASFDAFISASSSRPQGFSDASLNASIRVLFFDANPLTSGGQPVAFIDLDTPASPVPEPSTLALSIPPAVLLYAARRRSQL